MFKEKKVLFFCVKFFGYETVIREKLEDLGAVVHYYDERPKNDLLTKALIRINKNVVKKSIDEYYKNILKEIEGIEFDYLFIIKAEVTPKWFLETFRQNNQKTESVLFLWDSIVNCGNVSNSLHLFDKKYTFDYEDTKQYDLDFQPLFYAQSYANIAKDTEYEYDLLFVGTAHTDRYGICKKIEKKCIEFGLNPYFYYFLQSPYVFYHKKIFEEGFSRVEKKDISFATLGSSDNIALYQKSNVILDIQHTKQTGLTMRTLETLGAARKIITTNPKVKYYSFYQPENVLIIDRNNPIINKVFFEQDYKAIDKAVLYSYSIEGWLKNMFEPENMPSYLDEKAYNEAFEML